MGGIFFGEIDEIKRRDFWVVILVLIKDLIFIYFFYGEVFRLVCFGCMYSF